MIFVLIFSISANVHARWFKGGYTEGNYYSYIKDFNRANPEPTVKNGMLEKSTRTCAPGTALCITDPGHPEWEKYKAIGAANRKIKDPWRRNRNAYLNDLILKNMIATAPAGMATSGKIIEYDGAYSFVGTVTIKCSDLSFGGQPANPCNGKPQGTVLGQTKAPPTPTVSNSGVIAPSAQTVKEKESKVLHVFIKNDRRTSKRSL